MQLVRKSFYTNFIIFFGTLHFVRSAELRCFLPGTLDSATIIHLDNDANPETLLNSSCYSSDKNTIIYGHSILENLRDYTSQIIMQTYMDGGKTNVIGLDWSHEVSVPIVGLAAIPKTLLNTKLVAKKLGKFIVKLVKAGFSLDRLHLIGQSLGAHCMGNTGKYIKKCLKRSVPRITGLEPFGLFFEGPLSESGLNAKSAQFVDVIHTNPGVVGTVEALGTVDIWVNCKSNVQPGCEKSKLTNIGLFPPKDLCSHLLAAKYFSDAVSRDTDFIATSASSCKHWSKGEKTGNTIYLGDKINKTATGNYYIAIDSNTAEYQTAGSAKQNNDLQQRQLNIRELLKDIRSLL